MTPRYKSREIKEHGASPNNKINYEVDEDLQINLQLYNHINIYKFVHKQRNYDFNLYYLAMVLINSLVYIQGYLCFGQYRQLEPNSLLYTCSCTVGKKKVLFSMAIGNEKLMHECFLKHWRMGTARITDKEIEERKKRSVRMKISKAGVKRKKYRPPITT